MPWQSVRPIPCVLLIPWPPASAASDQWWQVILGSGQGRVPNHLACLKQCGLVATRRAGKFIYYRITDERVRLLLTPLSP